LRRTENFVLRSADVVSGRDMQLTKQMGESLVVAELGRQGFIAASFTGNVPDIDVLALSPSGHALAIQVKAIHGPSWQFDIRTFLNVRLVGNRQIVKGKKTSLDRNRLCVFVRLKKEPPHDFFVFRWGVLQDYFHSSYKGGIRPRNLSLSTAPYGRKTLHNSRINGNSSVTRAAPRGSNVVVFEHKVVGSSPTRPTPRSRLKTIDVGHKAAKRLATVYAIRHPRFALELALG
jgi:hypothetical protein